LNFEKIIDGLPRRTVAERATVRENASALAKNGTALEQAAACRVLEALDILVRMENDAIAERVRTLLPDQRVVEAFRTPPMTPAEINIVRVLLDNPDASSPSLTAKLGWGGMAWHLHFGKMCVRRGAMLWPAEPAITRKGLFYTGILTTYNNVTHGFTIKSEVAKGFAELGIRAA